MDSTFRARRGPRSILAYIRRASALPPPLPPARSGAAPSTPPLRAPPRTPARPTPGGDSRWDRPRAGGLQPGSLSCTEAQGSESGAPRRLASPPTLATSPSPAPVRSSRARGPESSARSAGGGAAGAAVVAALRLPALPEWGQSISRRETSVARRSGRGTFKLLLGGSSPPTLAPALGESGVWLSGCCYFSGLPDGGRIQPPAWRGFLLFVRLLVAFPFPPVHLCRR